MQKVLTAAQMREVDRLTTERYGIPGILLMENAAHAVARVVTEKLGGSVEGKSILILCGPGNNGGDGAALARTLAITGAHITAVLVGEKRTADGDARTNFGVLDAIARTAEGLSVGWYAAVSKGSIEVLHCIDLESWQGDLVAEKRFEADAIVDALFGTGLTRPLKGIYAETALSTAWHIEDRKGTKPLIFAIDLPSGLDADRAEDIGPHACADYTITFTAAKRANVLPGAARFGGELTVADIGSPAQLLDEVDATLEVTESDDLTNWLWESRFHDASYKNKRGHALIVAGSKNYTGAAVLCGDAAIRSGCGLVTIATPESSRESIVARVQPEVMVRGIAATEEGSASEKAVEEIDPCVKNVDVVAIGSGLSTHDETKLFVQRMVKARRTPLVIDADGLTALSPWGGPLQKPARQQGINTQRENDPTSLILTPHEGEFRKMLGLERGEFDELIKDRVTRVRDFATTHNVILVLKGERNLIAAPDGRVVVNPTGNSGLGKAGNGDTLTGIIAGFAAQAVQMEIDMFETVVAAVYVAGLAGDIAEKKYGKRIMTASDVRECLGEAFQQVDNRS